MPGLMFLIFFLALLTQPKKKKSKDHEETALIFTEIVLLCDREAENKTPASFWQTLVRHGTKCTEAPCFQYHV